MCETTRYFDDQKYNDPKTNSNDPLLLHSYKRLLLFAVSLSNTPTHRLHNFCVLVVLLNLRYGKKLFPG